MTIETQTVSDDEVLSALADDALSHEGLQQLMAQMRERGAQHTAARRLERYALLGELMRAEAGSPLFVQAQRYRQRDVVGSVMQQIASESAYGGAECAHPTPKSMRAPGLLGGLLAGWRAPALSMALAASVAGAILVLLPDGGVQHGDPLLTAQKAEPSTVAAVMTPSAPEDLTVSVPLNVSLAELEANADTMPDPYLLQHLTHAEGGPMRTLSSNVRLASYERP